MVSPKWQTTWVESQHCSKSIVNVPLPSQQAKKILEDLKTSCCSPNKAVQVEALKCWGLWIHNQNPDEWKLNTVCFTAVRPLITKKLQPLHKDVDICKLKLSLMWALLVKVQDIMQLEGPQYILEVFLQSCLTWLSSASGDGSENEISLLIFQLLLAVFNKSEALTGCDMEMFPPLSSDVLHLKKVFHLLADKFLNIFVYWRTVEDRSVILKIWKHFLEHCESSHEHIPIPVWHKVFKLAGQICSEKDEPVKERLAFLHGCATTLKSALSSSKFIDFGNLLTTPCEVLLKKLLELCTVECDEFRDSQMFWHSKEICQALSDKSVAISGYELCIGVLDALEEFCLRSLFWGVWCGLVYCYNALLKDTHRSHLTRIEMKFYRKLRGVAVNFELDRNDLHEDCIKEVEKHIGLLSIGCLRTSDAVETAEIGLVHRSEPETEAAEPPEVEMAENLASPECDYVGVSNEIAPIRGSGQFSLVPFRGRKNFAGGRVLEFNFDLIKDVLNALSLNSKKSLLRSAASFRFVRMRSADTGETGNSIELKVEVSSEKDVSLTVCCREVKVPPRKSPSTPVKKNPAILYEVDGERSESEEEVISTPTTRSRKRAEEEKKRESEMQRRRKRKSFEVLVQEIVRKNKERKTEKNSKRKRTSDAVKSKRKKRKVDRDVNKENEKVNNAREKKNKPLEVSDRKLRNSKKKDPAKDQKKKNKNSIKTDGKLENYFKVVTKKSGTDVRKEVKKPAKAEKSKKATRGNRCCDSREEKKQPRGETGWKQTSLKTMMNPKSKVEKGKQGTRTRDKSTAVTEERVAGRNGDRKVVSSPLAKMSPFKEVFHDHEYAKMEPGKMETMERILIAKKEKRTRASKGKENAEQTDLEKTKPKPVLSEKVENSETEASAVEKGLKVGGIEAREGESADAEAPTPAETESEKPEVNKTEVPELATTEEVKMEEREEPTGTETEVVIQEAASVNEEAKKPPSEPIEKSPDVQPVKTCFGENREEVSDCESIPERRGRKRMRMTDGLRPNKRMKLEEDEDEEGGKTEDPLEEKLPLEITEKENLEKRQPDSISPAKRDKTSLVPKSNGSPKAGGGGMSRALRIIGLVPESTMGKSWETSPKVEALKCKKAPNVDKNSRASKMLALLFENIVEADDAIKIDEEEINSTVASATAATTPNAKTPLSSLKSPKSIKKRRSIRFDDARNETVLYQIDTPPSQILEEKEKRRGTRPFEIALDLP